MLHLEVDARLVQAGGIGRFIRETTSRWLSRRDVAALRFLGRTEELEPWLDGLEGAERAEIVPWDARSFSPSAQLKWLTHVSASRGWKPDVTLFPHFDIPVLRTPRPSVTVVHDLIQLELPDFFPDWKRFVAAGLLRRIGSNTGRVVTVSHASRVSLHRFFAGKVCDIVVVPNGVSDLFRHQTAEECDRTAGGPPFVLCVATDRPHKNLSLSLQILSSLPEAENWRLVIVGLTRTDLKDLCQRSNCVNVMDRVEVMRGIKDEQLRDLYWRAVAVLVPSLLEGFALPAYEARACGRPVLALSREWSEQLASIGVHLISSASPSVWARRILEIKSRDREPKATRSEVEVPKWEDTAKRLLTVLEETASGLCAH
jgi:glycosyltransferase involved in cell wall biosynthesis